MLETSPELEHFTEECIAVRLGTDAMEPNFHCNDWFFIDPTDKRLIDGLAAFELPDEFEPRLFRVQHSYDGYVLLRTDNEKYSDQRVQIDRARLLMVGRVHGVLTAI